MSFFTKLKEKVAETVSSAVESTKDALGVTRLKEGLTKTREGFVNRLASALLPGRVIDEALLSEVEEIMLSSDIGVRTTSAILANVRIRARKQAVKSAEELYDLIKQEITDILTRSDSSLTATASADLPDHTKPYVIMIVGVNGVGKTTSIGKLAHNFKSLGQKVLIGAADTFRAAANEQLEVWAERAGVEIVKQKQGADPAAVAFDTLQAGIARQADVVIIDTAGRLHNKGGLMNELEKLSRVMRKLKPTAPDEVLLVLDATTGQNALQQAKEFMKVSPVTGLILTKLDGTAKGGVVIAVAYEFNIPVRYVGIGEKIGDLQLFNPTAFAEALFENKH
jgi:fused signal recognition particle receptor